MLSRLLPFILAGMLASGAEAAVTACPASAPVALQVLGSGGPIADDGRSSAAYLLWINGAARALIDAGGGAFLRFGEAGARFEDLDFVGLSHFHTDHSADLPALLKSGFFAQRSRVLPIAGPASGGLFPGLQAFLGSLLQNGQGAFGYLSGYLDGSERLARLEAIEVTVPAEGPVELGIVGDGRFSVEALPVPHGPVPTLAFRLRVGNMTVVLASDQNGSDPSFIDFARGADLLVMHLAISQNADPVARKLHAPPLTIGALAAEAGPVTLLLSHLMARSLANLEDNVSLVRSRYSGRVIVAEDLTCLPLNSRSE